jgi:hypothetical protein
LSGVDCFNDACDSRRYDDPSNTQYVFTLRRHGDGDDGDGGDGGDGDGGDDDYDDAMMPVVRCFHSKTVLSELRVDDDDDDDDKEYAGKEFAWSARLGAHLHRSISAATLQRFIADTDPAITRRNNKTPFPANRLKLHKMWTRDNVTVYALIRRDLTPSAKGDAAPRDWPVSFDDSQFSQRVNNVLKAANVERLLPKAAGLDTDVNRCVRGDAGVRTTSYQRAAAELVGTDFRLLPGLLLYWDTGTSKTIAAAAAIIASIGTQAV